MNGSVLVISMAVEMYGWGHRHNVLTASYCKAWKDYSLILLILLTAILVANTVQVQEGRGGERRGEERRGEERRGIRLKINNKSGIFKTLPSLKLKSSFTLV